MARTNNLTDFLNDVSAAIKSKLDDDTPIPAGQFDTKIMEIETVGNYQDKSITISSNGSYSLLPDTTFDAMSSVSIAVNVPTQQINNQNKTVNPTTSQQVISADEGYTGLGNVTVNAVTSSIDQNIQAQNIKKDITILGVTGTLSGDYSGTITPEEYEAALETTEDILGGGEPGPTEIQTYYEIEYD